MTDLLTRPGAAGEGHVAAPVLPAWALRAIELTFALVCVGAAVLSAISMDAGDKKGIVIPLALVGGLVVGVFALTRFNGFVLMLLAIRPALDVIKLSGASAGTTEGNSAAGRGADPSSMIAVLFLLAAALWLAARHFSGRRVPPSRLTLAWGMFIIACVLSLLASRQPQASAMEAMRIITVAVMFLVLEQMIDTEAMMKRVIAACYAGLAFPLVYTLVRILIGDPPSEDKGSFSRLTGPFSQSNTFARYLAFMIIFGVAIYPYLRPRLKVWMLAALGLSGVFMAMTLTRTALLGAVVGILVLAIVQRRQSLLVGLAAMSVIGMIALPGLADRIGSLASPDAAASDSSLEWRIRYWTEVLPLANRNPFTGIGLNATQYGTDAAKQPHNDFIRAYVEMGIVGLISFVMVQLALVTNGWRAVRLAGRQTFGGAVGAGALACAVTYLLASVAANLMSNVVSLWYLVAFAACASAAGRFALEDDARAAAETSTAPDEISSGTASRV